MGVLILGIESSCDETAAAVVRGGIDVLSNIVATQHELHETYAGVVPEIASRAHLERILPVIREARQEADVSWSDLDAIAIGHRPGLIGSLLVGVSGAKALAWSRGLPLIGIDHILAHLYGCRLNDDPVDYPAIGLVVSGGHTSLFFMRDALDIDLIGRTIDDAVGEAFDKAATILGLGYPGGPEIDRLARAGDADAHQLPIARLDGDCLDFSFSGLKTALLYAVRGRPRATNGETHFSRRADDLPWRERADFAAGFQHAAIEALMRRIRDALDRHDVKTLIIGGGVSANSLLRARSSDLAEELGVILRLPEPAYCIDNAAMIAGLAAERFQRGAYDDLTLAASPASAIT